MSKGAPGQWEISAGISKEFQDNESRRRRAFEQLREVEDNGRRFGKEVNPSQTVAPIGLLGKNAARSLNKNTWQLVYIEAEGIGSVLKFWIVKS